MKMVHRAIGFFDSGAGGLTVLKEVFDILPYESTVYFGDTGRAPYGSKSSQTITQFAIEDALFLTKYNVKMLVAACDTISAVALDTLKSKFDIPVVGIIEPVIQTALSATRNKKIGVIGTEATIDSGIYEMLLKKMDSGVEVFGQACPLLVSFAEYGWLQEEETIAVARKYLYPLKQEGIDTLILACSHFPLLKDSLQRALESEINIVDPATEAAKEVAVILREKKLESAPRNASHLYFVSDNPRRFKTVGERYLGKKILYVRDIKNAI
jgi:glutamate racemase